MNLTSIILILVIGFLVIMTLKFITGLAKAFFYAIIIFVLLAGLFAYFTYKDTRDLATGLANNDTLFLLKDREDLITGFTLSRLNLSSVKSLKSSQMSDFSGFYEKREYKKMLGDNYKLIIIDESVFPASADLKPDSVLEYIKEQGKNDELIQDIRPDYIPDPKAMAFSMLVVYSLRSEPSFIVDGYKDGNITIYPETLIFRLMRFMADKKK